MSVKFPSPEWPSGLEQKLNTDPRYAQIASKWEGDMVVVIEPAGPLKEQIIFYFDLWHGTCRKAAVLSSLEGIHPAFVLTATYDNIVKIITGSLNPMTAMMTRKLEVHGNMSMMMRNVPTVLDFVRCAREVTDEIL